MEFFNVSPIIALKKGISIASKKKKRKKKKKLTGGYMSYPIF